MKKLFYSAIGVSGFSVFAWIGYQLTTELSRQTRLRPVIDKTMSLMESHSQVRRHLGPPPYTLCIGGRRNPPPTYRHIVDISGKAVDEISFWMEGDGGRLGVATVRSCGNVISRISLEVSNVKEPIVLYNERFTGATRTSIFSRLSSWISP